MEEKMELLQVSGRITSHATNPTSKYFYDFSVDCDDGQKMMIRKVYGPEAGRFTPDSQIKAVLKKDFNAEDGNHWVIIAAETNSRAGKHIVLNDILTPNALPQKKISPAGASGLAILGFIISIVISVVVVSILGVFNRDLSRTTVLSVFGIFAILGVGLFISIARRTNRRIDETKKERDFLLQEVKKQGFQVNETVYTEY
jgi:hypothetical protein